MKNKLIVIGGPTAAGKTSLAIQLAQHYKCEILSADSRQFYREMSIGTAKPTEEELAAAPHHFVNNLSIEEEYSVGDFERDALAKLEEIYQKNDTAILVGGSGMYIRALCEGMDTYPNVPKEVKAKLEQEFKEKGMKFLWDELKEKDPKYFMKVDKFNPHRIIRALSVIRTSGKTFLEFQNQGKAERNFNPIYIALTYDREKLYERINQRVDSMLQEGLLDEVEKLYPKKGLKSLQTVGYQEFFQHYDGEISMEEAIELVKRNSRRYSKRQVTWFKNQQPAGGQWKYSSPTDVEGILAYIKEL